MDQSLNSSFQIHTFGCKVNTYDSGLLQQKMKNFEGNNVHILNTCAVTSEATKEAVRLIRRLKNKDPLCTVVVTGCAAQVDTEHFQNLDEADLIVANSHKMHLPDILGKYFQGELSEKVFKSNIFRKEDLEEGGGLEEDHTRAFVKIQDGCNSFCTFCVIPYARGKSRSLSVDSLVLKVNELYSKGIQEVVLTGVHIGDYEDQGFVLEDLVQSILDRTDVPRIRLTSLEPIEISDRLLDLYQNSRLCPHFHMSIQSANTEVLAHMKRKYDQRAVVDSLEKISKKIPGVFIGLDVIAGFPSETHEQFEDTFLTLAQTPWTRMHVFPYSERPGTRALQISPVVPWEERLRRASRLRDLSSSRLSEYKSIQAGRRKEVLLLKKSKNGWHGISRDYWNIQISNPELIETRLQQGEKIFEKEWSVVIPEGDSPSLGALNRENMLFGHIEEAR